MLPSSLAAARAVASLPLLASAPAPDKSAALFHAATTIAGWLVQNRTIDAKALREAMVTAFGASDSDGAWGWKDAYEACEAAQVLFLRKYGAAMRSRAGSAAGLVGMLERLGIRLPSHTRRSEESQHLQQFSTPMTIRGDSYRLREKRRSGLLKAPAVESAAAPA